MSDASWQDLAVAYANTQQWEQAQEALNSAATNFPGIQARIELELGLAAARRAEWRGASDHLDAARAVEQALNNTQRIQLDYISGVVAARQRKYSRAQKRLESALSNLSDLSSRARKKVLSASDNELALLLAYVLYKNNRISKALETLDGARLDDDGRQLKAALESAQAKNSFEAGDLKAALEHLERAAEYSSSTEIEINRAAIKLALGDESVGDELRKLTREDRPEALINYAIYLDKIAKDPAASYDYYARYVELGGPASAKVKKLLEIKARVFGLGD